MTDLEWREDLRSLCLLVAGLLDEEDRDVQRQAVAARASTKTSNRWVRSALRRTVARRPDDVG
jgi:hypothetical protein